MRLEVLSWGMAMGEDEAGVEGEGKGEEGVVVICARSDRLKKPRLTKRKAAVSREKTDEKTNIV